MPCRSFPVPSLREKKNKLIEAAQKGDYKTVRTLLANGMDIHTDDRKPSGGTALHYAAEKGHTEIVKLLLKNKADVNRGNATNGTPLLGAAKKGHIEIINILLDHGADIHATENSGKLNALMMASSANKPSAVKILLKRGADVHARDKDGRTALHAATWNISPYQVVKTLLSHGAEVDIQDRWGRTPLIVAALFTHPSISAVYLHLGADPNKKEKKKPKHCLTLYCPRGNRTDATRWNHAEPDPSWC